MQIAGTEAGSRRRGVRLLALLALLVTFAGAATGAAAPASAYPPSGAILSLSDRVVPPGLTFSANVSGCQPGEGVTFSLVGNDPVTVTCGPDGTATVTFVAPATPGTYEVTAVLASIGVTLVDSIRVVAPGTPTEPGTPGTPTAPGTPTTAGTLPRAGSGGVANAVLFGSGLVMLGGAFVAVARIRRRKVAAAPAPA